LRSLVDGAAAPVRVGCWNVDDTTDPARPAHTELPDAGIPCLNPGRGGQRTASLWTASRSKVASSITHGASGAAVPGAIPSPSPSEREEVQ
jgi:hypothetical protein